MLITKKTKEVVSQIFYQRGLKGKEENVLLFTIVIPSQSIHYNVTNNQFIEEPIKVEVKKHIGNEFDSNAGTWPLESFTKFVEGVKIVTETALPYLKSNLDFIAQAKISETTHVWSKFIEEKVAGGVFKKTEVENIQNISFSILGLQSDYVRWNKEMLKPLIVLKDDFLGQMERFKERINKVTNNND